MVIKISIRRKMDKLIKAVNDVKAIVQQHDRLESKIIQSLNEKYNTLIGKQLERIADNAVDNFYDAYTDRIYDPSMSLKDDVKIFNTNNKWEIQYGPFSSKRHYTDTRHWKIRNETAIYYNAFVQGNHGFPSVDGNFFIPPHSEPPATYIDKNQQPVINEYIDKINNDYQIEVNAMQMKLLAKMQKIVARIRS